VWQELQTVEVVQISQWATEHCSLQAVPSLAKLNPALQDPQLLAFRQVRQLEMEQVGAQVEELDGTW
jgi:hypothetical protein